MNKITKDIGQLEKEEMLNIRGGHWGQWGDEKPRIETEDKITIIIKKLF